MSCAKQNRRIVALAAVMGASLLSGCGGSSGSVANTPAPVAPTNGITGGGCLPLTGQIPFTGTGIYFDWANIVAGRLPVSGQQIGQVVLGGNVAGGPYQRSGVDGTISLNITQGNQPLNGTSTYPYNPQYGYPNGGLPWGQPTYPYNPYGGTTGFPGGYNNVPGAGLQPMQTGLSGFVAISPQTQQDIVYQFTGGSFGFTNQYYGGYPNPTGGAVPPSVPMPGMPNGQVCVSGIAIDAGHYYTTIYEGTIYLYLNNTAHGYKLYF